MVQTSHMHPLARSMAQKMLLPSPPKNLKYEKRKMCVFTVQSNLSNISIDDDGVCAFPVRRTLKANCNQNLAAVLHSELLRKGLTNELAIKPIFMNLGLG